MPAVALQDKTSSLARQLARDLNSRLVLVMRSSRQNALFVRNLIVCIPHSPYYKYTYTHKMQRSSRENFEREILKKNKIDSSTIFIICSPNSSTFTLSIVIFLRGTLAQSLSHHTHLYEEVIWCLGSSSEGTNSFWLM